MKEHKVADILPIESFLATSLSLEEYMLPSSQHHSFAVISDEIEANYQKAEVKNSEMSLAHVVTDGISLEQEANGSRGISKETATLVDGIVAASSDVHGIQAPEPSKSAMAGMNSVPQHHSFGLSVLSDGGIPTPQCSDNSKSVMSGIMQQSEDGVVYAYPCDVENCSYKTSSEMKSSELDQTEEGSILNGNLGYTVHVEHANINRNPVDAVMKANKCFQVEDESVPNEPLLSGEAFEPVKHVKVNGGHVDTAEAVSRFGGIIDWKGHKALGLEGQEEILGYKKRLEDPEEAKDLVVKELDSSRGLVEELRLSLEKAQMEESQAKEDLELSRFRAEEMDLGIAGEGCAAAKARLEAVGSRYAAATVELKYVKEELEAVQGEYESLVRGRDMAIGRVDESVSASKDVETAAKDPSLKLITARESVESAHASHIEAEEHRITAAMATDQDAFIWDKELKLAVEELQCLKEQHLPASELKSKLGTASRLLLSLQDEQAAYMEAKLNEEFESMEGGNLKAGTHTSVQTSIATIKKGLGEVKIGIRRAKDEVNCLAVAARSHEEELENEEAALAHMKQREEVASIIISSLEAELYRTMSEIKLAQVKENESRARMVELPKLLQETAREADEAKSVVRSAREELRKVREEADRVQASATAIESRFHATLKEIEALTVSETWARAVVNAVQESEHAVRMGVDDSPEGVTLPLDEYYMLSDRAHKARESADERVDVARSEVELAKKSELRTLKRLEAANRELVEKKEAVRVAPEKPDRARDGKLAADQELRTWRSKDDQLTEAANDAPSTGNFEEHREQQSLDDEQEAAVPVHPAPTPKTYTPDDDAAGKRSESKTRKKSLFPRLIKFLAR